MDVNNTKYHLIYGERDWLPLLFEQSSVDIWWDRKRKSISLAPVVQLFDDLARSDLLSEDNRRGAACDHYGNIYWINTEQNEINYHPAATPLEIGSYWHVDALNDTAEKGNAHGDFNPLEEVFTGVRPTLRGLTVSSHEYLVVGTLQPAGLLVFDLHAGGPPTWLRWPTQISFAPFDMGCVADGGIWVLDRDFDNDESRIWHLDKSFRVLDCSGESVDLPTPFSGDFYPQVPAEEGTETIVQNRFLSGLSLNLDSPVIAENPIAIEALSRNSFILLNTSLSDETSTIHYFVDGELVSSILLDTEVIGGLLDEPMLLAHDFAFVPEVSDNERMIVGTLYIVVTHAKQSYKFALRAIKSALILVLQPSFLPMRAYSGKALIATGKTAYYDFGNRWLPLTEQPRQHYQSQAQINGIIKDSEEPDCVWHRIIIDACIPPGTSISFESRTANTEQTLGDATWQVEPQLHLRSEGAELPFYQAFNKDEINSETTGSWDLLLQNAVGRYLELKITLKGNKRSTPRIRSCRIYYPRFSYLDHYLPAVYQDDVNSANFLDRFLANIEGLYTGLEDKIAGAESLFDTRTSPPEFLEWLAGWLGASVDSSWDEHRKRVFIDNAVLLFKWRGTLLGLRTLLKLSIDPCPDERMFDQLKRGGLDTEGLSESASGDIRIVEHFLTRRDPGIVLNDTSATTTLESQSSETQWNPALGAGVLHNKYHSFLSLTYAGDIKNLNSVWGETYTRFSEITFPPLIPDHPAQKRDWQYFTRDFIGFTYSEVSIDDQWRYQDYLHRRYRQVSKLSASHGLLGNFKIDSFDDIELPNELPENKRALQDWIEFVSLALPISQQAHRFTVLLPTVLGDLPAALELRRAQVEEIVNREKPAHTQFDVKYFWAMFQVGSARLGVDTSLGDGGRFVALVLGKNFLGQSFLAESHPWSVVDRSIVGRERLAPPLEWRV